MTESVEERVDEFEANKPNITFESTHMFGFDMDHTIAKYHVKTLEYITHKTFLHYLNQHFGIPKSYLQCGFHGHVTTKGVISHLALGNQIRINREMKITHAFHGTTKMSDEEIEQVYPNRDVPEEFEPVKRHPEFLVSHSYFETALSDLFSFFVTQWDGLTDEEKEVLPWNDYKEIMEILKTAFEYNYTRFDRGWFYPEVINNLDKLIYKRPHLREWLESLNKAGKLVVLITNSFAEYTDLLMVRTLGEDWRSLFDVVVCYSGKPRFFSETNPFFSVDPQTYEVDFDNEVRSLQPGDIVRRGNVQDLVTSIESWGKYTSPFGVEKFVDMESWGNLVVAYFGDNLVSDIVGAKTHTEWHTVIILDELDGYEYDLESLEHDKEQQETEGKDDSHVHLKNGYGMEENDQEHIGVFFLEDELDEDGGLIETKVMVDSEHPLSKATTQSKQWGHYTVDEDGQLSFWATMALQNSDVALPCLSHLIELSMDQAMENQLIGIQEKLGTEIVDEQE